MKDGGKIKVLIIDKSDTIRKEISSVFSDHSRIKIFDIVQDYKNTLKFIAKNKADVIIIDADTDEIECFNIINNFNKKKNGAAIILWSCHPEKTIVDKARKAGASACIPKDRDWTQLASIIQAVAHGNCYFWISPNFPKPEHVSCSH